MNFHLTFQWLVEINSSDLGRSRRIPHARRCSGCPSMAWPRKAINCYRQVTRPPSAWSSAPLETSGRCWFHQKFLTISWRANGDPMIWVDFAWSFWVHETRTQWRWWMAIYIYKWLYLMGHIANIYGLELKMKVEPSWTDKNGDKMIVNLCKSRVFV